MRSKGAEGRRSVGLREEKDSGRGERKKRVTKGNSMTCQSLSKYSILKDIGPIIVCGVIRALQADGNIKGSKTNTNVSYIHPHISMSVTTPCQICNDISFDVYEYFCYIHCFLDRIAIAFFMNIKRILLYLSILLPLLLLIIIIDIIEGNNCND